jgi:ferrochelatase
VSAATADTGLGWEYPDDWHLHPQFLALWERLIREALDKADDDPVVIFTNHSLPARILSWNDPYPAQFSATVGKLVDRLGLEKWSLAFQSAGGGGQPWIGPSLFEVIGDWISREAASFVVAPIGFLVDHLEVRYDLDLDARKMAEELGVSLRRTDMPNDEPEMVEMLVDLVRTSHASTMGRDGSV